MEEKPTDQDSLESPSTTAASSSQDGDSLEGGSNATQPEAPKASSAGRGGVGGKVRGLIQHLNIYLLLFLLILVVTGGFILISVQRNKKEGGITTINTQTLTADELKKLTEQEQKVGDPKSTLSIESNAIFNGKVLVRDSLDVAGTIKVGSSLSLPGISVSGTSTFDQIQANNLGISGNTTIQGQLNAKGLTISGGGSFGGAVSVPSLTVGSLQLTNALQVTNHIDAGGGVPGVSGGAGIGGSDTAGKINNVTGSGGSCPVRVTFAKKYNETPFVVIAPTNSAAANSNYYVGQENTSGFSICFGSAGGSGLNFSYIAIE